MKNKQTDWNKAMVFSTVFKYQTKFINITSEHKGNYLATYTSSKRTTKIYRTEINSSS